MSSVNWDPTISSKNPLTFAMEWLHSNTESLKVEDAEQNQKPISWSGYNSRFCEDFSKYRSPSVMLPLMKDNVNSPSVIRHTMDMDIVMQITKKLNPEQTPVWTGDEPVYAIGKQFQRLYPDKYDKDKLVHMLGKIVFATLQK